MTARSTDKRAAASRPVAQTVVMQVWRIADGRFDPFSPMGALLLGGRWNSPGVPVLYASLTFAGAMLEVLAHTGNGRIPRTQVSVRIELPADALIEKWSATRLPAGWAGPDLVPARSVGDEWLRSQRSLGLIVPSVVAQHESNVLINPAHPSFGEVRHQAPEPVVWDRRLFRAKGG